MNRLVSIVMPTYNCAGFIAESVRTVLDQTYPHWELIIVDDASTDNTAEVLAPFLKDSRIRYVVQEQNGGAAVARSKALSLVTGDYVAFLDSDDLWHPEKLERQLAFMQEKNAAGIPCWFTATAYTQIDDNGNSLHLALCPPKRAGYWKMLFLSNPIGNSATMYDRTHFGDLTVPTIKKRNDFALWLSMLRGGEYCFGISDRLMTYRVRTGSLSANKLSLMKYHWHLYRQVEKLPALVSAFAVFCWAFVKSTGFGLNRQKTDD